MKDTTSYPLQIDSRYYNTLDIEAFSQMMKDPSYCYKFYWLEAIVRLISENITETTFDAIIDEMIANAWYSVREFHVHLSGLKSDGSVGDGLERAILLLSELSSRRILPENRGDRGLGQLCPHDCLYPENQRADHAPSLHSGRQQ